eukprot:513286-Rhodomonas_salina.1
MHASAARHSSRPNVSANGCTSAGRKLEHASGSHLVVSDSTRVWLVPGEYGVVAAGLVPDSYGGMRTPSTRQLACYAHVQRGVRAGAGCTTERARGRCGRCAVAHASLRPDPNPPTDTLHQVNRRSSALTARHAEGCVMILRGARLA